ncbi:MAG: radical SAM protein [Candidatus Anammoximicrobium sp.]|nr:radical SAM protein [Candidatus Anammoximicrobium sp.]
MSLQFRYRLIKKVLTTARPRAIAHLTRNYVVQGLQVLRQNLTGRLYPTAMHLEITTYCRFDCQGCYITSDERRDESIMPDDVAERAIQWGKRHGVGIFTLIGGEPLTTATLPLIKKIVAKHSSVAFFCCSNAAIFSTAPDAVAGILELDNLSIVVSLDGFAETNDALRGHGSFQRTMRAARTLREQRCFFGVLVTLRRCNLAEATSPEFVSFLSDSGFHYLGYSISEGIDASLLQDVLTRAARLMGQFPIFLYCTDVGPMDLPSGAYRHRIVYVSRDGRILNDRRERIVITDIEGTDGGAETVVECEPWKRRFTKGWRPRPCRPGVPDRF